MKELLTPIIENLKEIAQTAHESKLFWDNQEICLGPVSCKIELKEFPCDWGWLSKISVTGTLPLDLHLRQCDCFSMKMISLDGVISFQAGISGFSEKDGQLAELTFSSFGPIEKELT